MPERRKNNPGRTRGTSQRQSQPGRRSDAGTTSAGGRAAKAPTEQPAAAMLRGVADVLTQLARVPAGKSAEIRKLLQTVGETADVDRVYVFRFHEERKSGRRLMSQLHEWVAEGVSEQIDNQGLQSFPTDEMPPEFNEGFDQGEPVRVLRDDVSGWFAEELDRQEILAMLGVPIIVADRTWGFVGFDDCHRPRRWSQPEVDMLTALAGALGCAATCGQL